MYKFNQGKLAANIIIVIIVAFVLGIFSALASPGLAVWFGCLVLLSVFPIVNGKIKWRIIAIILLILSLCIVLYDLNRYNHKMLNKKTDQANIEMDS